MTSIAGPGSERVSDERVPDSRIKNGCPFCGAVATVETSGHFTKFYMVECSSSDCGAEGPPHDTDDQAIAAWDRRILSTNHQESVK